jgi:hypothetical protein
MPDCARSASGRHPSNARQASQANFLNRFKPSTICPLIQSPNLRVYAHSIQRNTGDKLKMLALELNHP